MHKFSIVTLSYELLDYIFKIYDILVVCLTVNSKACKQAVSLTCNFKGSFSGLLILSIIGFALG